MAEQADVMEQRLREWAAWLTGGGNGAGYSAMSVIHPNWMPPTPGTTPTLKVSASNAQRERALHAAVLSLSRRLQATLLVHYCKRLSVADQAAMLECAEPTVHARVREAKRLLAEMLRATGAVISYS